MCASCCRFLASTILPARRGRSIQAAGYKPDEDAPRELELKGGDPLNADSFSGSPFLASYSCAESLPGSFSDRVTVHACKVMCTAALCRWTRTALRFGPIELNIVLPQDVGALPTFDVHRSSLKTLDQGCQGGSYKSGSRG